MSKNKLCIHIYIFKGIKFLELEDITDGMSEPCVMDVKIGRRTWDPLATPEKRASEELKYPESKRAYGFCIPGFQVYRVPSGNIKRFDKSYGKKLDSKTIVEGNILESIRLFSTKNST